MDSLEHPKHDVHVGLEEHGAKEDDCSGNVVLVVQLKQRIITKYKRRSKKSNYILCCLLCFRTYLIINTIPNKVMNTLIISKGFNGSFKKARANMTTHTGEAAEIILASAMGMCFKP